MLKIKKGFICKIVSTLIMGITFFIAATSYGTEPCLRVPVGGRTYERMIMAISTEEKIDRLLISLARHIEKSGESLEAKILKGLLESARESKRSIPDPSDNIGWQMFFFESLKNGIHVDGQFIYLREGDEDREFLRVGNYFDGVFEARMRALELYTDLYTETVISMYARISL
jgi:hypothetical protein